MGHGKPHGRGERGLSNWSHVPLTAAGREGHRERPRHRWTGLLVDNTTSGLIYRRLDLPVGGEAGRISLLVNLSICRSIDLSPPTGDGRGLGPLNLALAWRLPCRTPDGPGRPDLGHRQDGDRSMTEQGPVRLGQLQRGKPVAHALSRRPTRPGRDGQSGPLTFK